MSVEKGTFSTELSAVRLRRSQVARAHDKSSRRSRRGEQARLPFEHPLATHFVRRGRLRTVAAERCRSSVRNRFSQVLVHACTIEDGVVVSSEGGRLRVRGRKGTQAELEVR